MATAQHFSIGAFILRGRRPETQLPQFLTWNKKPKFFRFHRTTSKDVRRIFSIYWFFATWCTFEKKFKISWKNRHKIIYKKILCNIKKILRTSLEKAIFNILIKFQIDEDLFELCFQTVKKKVVSRKTRLKFQVLYNHIIFLYSFDLRYLHTIFKTLKHLLSKKRFFDFLKILQRFNPLKNLRF